MEKFDESILGKSTEELKVENIEWISKRNDGKPELAVILNTNSEKAGNLLRCILIIIAESSSHVFRLYCSCERKEIGAA